jgi:hypothetical protein
MSSTPTRQNLAAVTTIASLVPALAGAATGAAAAAKPSAGNLDARKTKVEAQLADWVHCDSSKTPEGKAKVQQLTDQLDAIKAQLKAADDAKVKADQASAPHPSTAPRQTQADATYGPSARATAPGGLLDVVA